MVFFYIYKDFKPITKLPQTGIEPVREYKSRRILSHLVPTDFPRTSWYEMELRVPKNGDFLPARNSLNDKFLANSV